MKIKLLRPVSPGLLRPVRLARLPTQTGLHAAAGNMADLLMCEARLVLKTAGEASLHKGVWKF